MIKFLVMDVDGTLTDGKIYMGADGEIFKAFDIKDGYALHTLLKEHDIIPVIITARKSPMVEHRCKELGVTEIHQGVMNKLDCLKGILEKYSSADQQYGFSNVAYIGDDLLDLQCMNPIKESGGLAGCPSNAAFNVVKVCDFVAQHKGGEGAVRDFVDYIVNKKVGGQPYINDIDNRCQNAVNYLSQLKGNKLSLGRHEVNEYFYYNVVEYETSGESNKPFESHRKYVDIQILIKGEEEMQIVDEMMLHPVKAYDHEKDIILYHSGGVASKVIFRPGSVMILFPNNAHRSLSAFGKASTVKKIVGKLSIKKWRDE